MKVYRKIVLDVASGARLYEDVTDWYGQVAECKTPKIKTPKVPPETPEEKEAKQISLFSQRQGLFEQGFEVDPDSPAGQIKFRKRALTPEETEEKEFNTLVNKRVREQFALAPGEVTPAQQKAIDEIYGSEERAGNEAIKQLMTETMGARGLGISDSPALRELGLRAADLQSSLRGARAGSILNFADRERLFAQGQREFGNTVQQQRLFNLSRTGGQGTELGLGLGNQRANIFSSMANASAQRGRSGSIWGQLGGGLLGAAGQIGAAGIPRGFFSSLTFKENISLKETDDLVRDLLKTPIYNWNYKGNDVQHIGPVTEELPREVVTPDGLSISPIDIIGALLATVQALSKRIEHLEQR